MKTLALAVLLLGSQIVIRGHECTVTRSFEDGAQIAHCENHRVYALDPDTQTWNRTHKPPQNHYGR